MKGWLVYLVMSLIFVGLPCALIAWWREKRKGRK
jgi:hypothetical protein